MKSELVRNMRMLAELLEDQSAEAWSIIGDKRLAKVSQAMEQVVYLLSEIQFKQEQGENHGNNEAE